MANLGWSTNTDWTAAQSTTNIDINSGTFELADAIPDSDDYQSYVTGNFPPSPYQNLVGVNAFISEAESYIGDKSFEFADSTNRVNSNNKVAVAESTFGPYNSANFTIEMHYKELSSSTGAGIAWLSDTGEEIVTVGTSNPEVDIFSGNGGTTLLASPSPEYGEWRRFEITLNFNAATFDVLWEDLTGTSTSQSVSGLPFVNNNASNVGTAEFVQDVRGSLQLGNGSIEDVWFDGTTTID